ncbi:MAG: chromate efflux transporter [Cyanophyceae cyanobacterium]
MSDSALNPHHDSDPLGVRLWQLAGLFFRLGSTGFGGPQAHIAMQNEAVVQRRGWMSQEEFLAGMAICEMLPGPASTQVGIFIGYWRAGIPGALVAGLSFIIPAYLIEVVLSWAYFRYQALPQLSFLFLGIAPVVIALIVAFCWKLGKKAIKSGIQMAIAVAVFALLLSFGINVVFLFIGSAIVGLIVCGPRSPWGGPPAVIAKGSSCPSPSPDQEPSSPGAKASQQLLLIGIPSLLRVTTSWTAGLASVSPEVLAASSFWGAERIEAYFWPLALFFLKVGSAVYGGGLVIIPFISSEVVDQLGWMTQTEFLDGVAIGQFTPGPVVLTAAFVGYKVAGFWGSLVASVAIFLPSFAFIMVATPLMLKVHKNPWIRAALQGVTPAALGAIAAAAVTLGRGAFWQDTLWLSGLTVVIALLALLGLLRFKVPSWVLVPMGAAIGLVLA